MPQQAYGSLIPSLRTGNAVAKRPSFLLPRRACRLGYKSFGEISVHNVVHSLITDSIEKNLLRSFLGNGRKLAH